MYEVLDLVVVLQALLEACHDGAMHVARRADRAVRIDKRRHVARHALRQRLAVQAVLDDTLRALEPRQPHDGHLTRLICPREVDLHRRPEQTLLKRVLLCRRRHVNTSSHANTLQHEQKTNPVNFSIARRASATAVS